jgi:hypothetical protein
MDSIIRDFVQNDGIVVIDVGSRSSSRDEFARELSTLGCGDCRVLTLRRLPGVLVIGWEIGADLVARVYGKLAAEFFEALGRVVVGSEVLVNGKFKTPTGVVGPYFFVAVAGTEFGDGTMDSDRDLVAVDLSTTGIRELPESVFSHSSELAAVAFPPELESIGFGCFFRCAALRVVDLGVTQLKMIGDAAFFGSGVTQVSVPASLWKLGANVFEHTPLKLLDLSACDGIRVDGSQTNSLVELSLPFGGFAAAAEAFMPGSRVEVLRADVDKVAINELLPHLDGLGLDKLRIVSSLVGEYEWQRPDKPALVELTDPEAVTTSASVKLTAWRGIPIEWKPFLRFIDLSGLVVEVLPDGATLNDLVWLEGVVLPTGLQELPTSFFARCSRLSSVDTGRTALEYIGEYACEECKSLAAFAFPRTVRILEAPSDGTSITTIDLTSTLAEEVLICNMFFLVDLVLPRRCVVTGLEGVPALRRVTFWVSKRCSTFTWQPTEVRFESLDADADFSPGLLEARVYGEVACEMGCETIPFPPP